MDTKVKPVSRQELAKEIEKKSEREVEKKLYSSGDVSRITGWSRAYVLRLEKTRPGFPKAMRLGVPRGAKDKNDHLKRPRFWDEEGLRLILGIKRGQDHRLGRL
jgi:predicted DNA-binding transcriptional regulator AlpA